MPRENPMPNAGQRKLEVYNDFSGGLNSETSNEKLKINESPVFQNIDMNGRGSARRRYGRTAALTTFPTGNAQGAFFYFRDGQNNPDLILAVAGEFFLVHATPVQVTNEALSGSGASYTAAKPYIAANSQVVTVNGNTQEYVPDPSEAPLVSVVASSNGTIPVGTYTIGYTYTVTTDGSYTETKVSPTVTVSVVPGQQLQIQPISLPIGTTGVNYYISIDSTLRLAGSSAGVLSYITSLPTSGATEPPTTNNATSYTIDYATGAVTFPASVTSPIMSYQYEMEPLPITGLTSFQTTRPVEAVQYEDILYIATGTKLCQYDGTSVTPVDPYKPTTMEAIYIGTNGLDPNPSQYISDGTQSSGITVAGVIPNTTQPVVNQPVTFTCYVNVASSITTEDYRWQYKKSSDTTWTVGLDWANNTSGTNKTWTFSFPTAEPYDIQVTARDANATTTVSAPFYMTAFNINATPQPANLNASHIQECNRIIVYYDRLLLSGCTDNPGYMFLSDIRNFAYFPMDNTIDWDLGRREVITKVIIFRNELIVFTRSTVQSLTGESPSNYKKGIVTTEYGAMAGDSVQVINNSIFFLSTEGLMSLDANMFLSYFVISRIDYPIRSALVDAVDENASSTFFDNQYWLCLPSSKIIYRFYFDFKAWVMDTSSKLNFNKMVQYGSLLYNLGEDSSLYLVDKSVYTDAGEIYTMKVQSKFFDFDDVFVQKKLKRVYVLAQHYQDHNVNISTTVQADAAISLTPNSGTAIVTPNGTVNWVSTTAPNFQFYAGTTLGSWIIGTSGLGTTEISVQESRISGNKASRIRVTFEHAEPNLCEIFGVAFMFRSVYLH